MARPTKLNQDIIDKAYEYLDECSDVSVHTLLPTIEGLAIYLKCHRDTLYAWEKENKAFSDILEDLRKAQANKILQNSMMNRYNSTISKLMLSKHGYIEQKDITSGGEKLNSLDDKELDAIIARASKASKDNKA